MRMGQEAAAKGYSESIIKNQRQNLQEINGIKFRYYLNDNGGVTNVHPE